MQRCEEKLGWPGGVTKTSGWQRHPVQGRLAREAAGEADAG